MPQTSIGKSYTAKMLTESNKKTKESIKRMAENKELLPQYASAFIGLFVTQKRQCLLALKKIKDNNPKFLGELLAEIHSQNEVTRCKKMLAQAKPISLTDPSAVDTAIRQNSVHARKLFQSQPSQQTHPRARNKQKLLNKANEQINRGESHAKKLEMQNAASMAKTTQRLNASFSRIDAAQQKLFGTPSSPISDTDVNAVIQEATLEVLSERVKKAQDKQDYDELVARHDALRGYVEVSDADLVARFENLKKQ